MAIKVYVFLYVDDINACFAYENADTFSERETKPSGAGMSSLKRFYHRVKIRSRKINGIYKGIERIRKRNLFV